MRRFVVVSVLFLAMTACKKKAPEAAAEAEGAAAAPTDAGGFVDIAMDPEEDLAGSELMVATGKCGELVQLEPAAMMGKLKDGEIRCLEDSLRNAEKQTIKDKISRVLMADAWTKGDAHRWESIVRRHLNEIDRSDADLCYKFAKQLSDRGPEYSDEVIRWSEVALENRTQWVGDTHISRVNALFKLRALAALHLWEYAEKKYTENQSDDTQKTKENARNLAKTNAREWLEYARSAGKDVTTAMQLCVSAAGTEDFCKQGE
jgi:hypothetical protein